MGKFMQTVAAMACIKSMLMIFNIVLWVSSTRRKWPFVQSQQLQLFFSKIILIFRNWNIIFWSFFTTGIWFGCAFLWHLDARRIAKVFGIERRIFWSGSVHSRRHRVEYSSHQYARLLLHSEEASHTVVHGELSSRQKQFIATKLNFSLKMSSRISVRWLLGFRSGDWIGLCHFDLRIQKSIGRWSWEWIE